MLCNTKIHDRGERERERERGRERGGESDGERNAFGVLFSFPSLMPRVKGMDKVFLSVENRTFFMKLFKESFLVSVGMGAAKEL